MKTAVPAVLVGCFISLQLVVSAKKWFPVLIRSSLFLTSLRCISISSFVSLPSPPLCKMPAQPARLLMLSCSTNHISTENCWLDVVKLKHGPQNIKKVVDRISSTQPTAAIHPATRKICSCGKNVPSELVSNMFKSRACHWVVECWRVSADSDWDVWLESLHGAGETHWFPVFHCDRMKSDWQYKHVEIMEQKARAWAWATFAPIIFTFHVLPNPYRHVKKNGSCILSEETWYSERGNGCEKQDTKEMKEMGDERKI